jgi:hypothetical protein
MDTPDLLGKQGTNRGYATKLGSIFHINVKEAIRRAINMVYAAKFQKVVEYKEKNGWIKDHVKADIESFEFVADIMCHPLNHAKLSGWKDRTDTNYQMLRKGVVIKAAIQDEDSFYDMIELVRMKWVHDHWDRYERSAEQAYQIINFPNFYEKLIAHYEAMKEPLPDITDEADPEEIDYIKMEKRLTNGMDNKRKRAREGNA